MSLAVKDLARSVYYGMLEACTPGEGVKRSICGEEIRFPARWSRYYEPDYEPHTFSFLRQQCRPGGIVLDIGAHIGLFSIAMARWVSPSGKVFSFEPCSTTREVLQETVRLNGYGEAVEVHGFALSE